ncbi:hypothetical protein J6590_049543 [Homalodisca vitripennis]|nr:hypothetical protein J6590_049543 [Homalodisca vitripennis]
MYQWRVLYWLFTNTDIYCNTDGERKEETWILAYLKFAGVTTSMLPRPGWLWGEAPEITGRQHTSTQLCAGTGQVSSFLSPTVNIR